MHFLAKAVLATVLGTAGMATTGASAAVYSLAGQFSSSNDGNPWAYGYITSPTSSTFFPTYSAASSSNPIEGWSDPSLPQTSVYGTPNDDHNTSASQYQNGTVVWLGNQATFHPGQNSEEASYRFTAPTTSFYSLSSSFGGRDFVGPTDTRVSISVADESAPPVFSSIIDGYAGDATRSAFGASPTASFDDRIYLTKGENLYFNVGFDPTGTRGSGPFYYDTTSVAATLTSGVPEPSTWVMMLIGFGAIGFLAHRRAVAARGEGFRRQAA